MLPPVTDFFSVNLLSKSRNPTQGKIYKSHLMCSVINSWCLWHPSITWDPSMVKDSSWLELFPLCCAAVKPDLPPGGRSHYSKDGFQLQELSEKAGHELQTPSGELEREAGDWHGAKPEPRSHRVAQLQAHHRGTARRRSGPSMSHTPARGFPNPEDPKSKANKMKEPTALGISACLLH